MMDTSIEVDFSIPKNIVHDIDTKQNIDIAILISVSPSTTCRIPSTYHHTKKCDTISRIATQKCDDNNLHTLVPINADSEFFYHSEIFGVVEES